ncbi:MAG TPA: hypothetical protein VFP68_10840 [Burkholderiaceae bacterium]|nr:hypothetical protein [Burkholderiaceae bacterium]
MPRPRDRLFTRRTALRWATLAAAFSYPLHALAARWTVGPGGRLPTLRDALMQAAPGDTIDLLPGVYHGEVGVIEKNGLRIRGLPPRPVLHADGQDAEGKAILVVRADNVTLENLELRGCRVASGNGAGVRFERGRLMVRGCAFLDNEMGLLTANDPSAMLSLDDCEFGQAPRHEGALHHLLYAGTIGELVVSRCRFSGGFRGHLLKSRARRSRILHNRLIDGDGGIAQSTEL